MKIVRPKNQESIHEITKDHFIGGKIIRFYESDNVPKEKKDENRRSIREIIKILASDKKRPFTEKMEEVKHNNYGITIKEENGIVEITFCEISSIVLN
jgi:hypothetical protein